MKIWCWYLKPLLRNSNFEIVKNFQKLFLYAKGKELEWKNDKIWISQKWFEISTPNFHQLLTSLGTRFVPKIKVLGASKFGFPAKNLQNFKWAWQTQFLSHTLIILENWISFEGKQMLLPSFFDISNGLNFPKNLKSCTVQI